MRVSKHDMADLRVIGVTATALAIFVTLLYPEPVQESVKPRVARGEPLVQITSFALSPTGTQMATTNTAGRIALRAAAEWLADRAIPRLSWIRYGRCILSRRPFPRRCGTRAQPLHLGPGLVQERASHFGATPDIPSKCMMFSPDGSLLAITNAVDGTILFWDLATQPPAPRPTSPFADRQRRDLTGRQAARRGQPGRSADFLVGRRNRCSPAIF